MAASRLHGKKAIKAREKQDGFWLDWQGNAPGDL
jgi:hypothetical protein